MSWFYDKYYNIIDMTDFNNHNCGCNGNFITKSEKDCSTFDLH